MPRELSFLIAGDRWAVPAEIADADRRLVGAFEAVIEEGKRRAALHLACRLGCTRCCIGPFDVTALDAARLRTGLKHLAARDAEAARALQRRAAAQWRRMAAAFPGDADSGVLAADEAAREAFLAHHADVPCPVLDPATGACLLYPWRPLSCRSFGLPVRYGNRTLAPCPLNFTAATPEEIEAASVEPDAVDLEGELLARCTGGDTLVCAVVSGRPGP